MGDIHDTMQDGHKVNEVRHVLEVFLQQLQVSYKVIPRDQQFYDKCTSIAGVKGCPIDTDPAAPSILPFLRTGVTMAQTGYSHIESESTQILIALYTTFVAYLDDLFGRDVEKMYLFNERFIRQQKHEDPVLEGLSALLGDMNLHFDRIAVNIIVTDTLNFVTSLLLDYETQGVKHSTHAHSYPDFLRLMSGIPSAYAMFVFPPQIPIKSYIQALPEMRLVINFLNDVISFYKEEVRGETDNYISVTAATSGRSKFEIFQTLSKDVVAANNQILKILQDDAQALGTWTSFLEGYVYFHTSSGRYSLDYLIGPENKGAKEGDLDGCARPSIDV